MSDVVYVSSEEKLKESLSGNHKLTVINADYEPTIFDGYNIQYCFNETPEYGEGEFFRLKHIFHPFKGTSVIYDSNIYKALLNKVMRNHSVAFILKLSNLKLLRLCQCFLGAISESSHIDPTRDDMDGVMNNFWFGSSYASSFNQNITDEAKNWSPVPYIIGKAEIHPGIQVPIWSYYWDVKIKKLRDVLDDTFFQSFGDKFSYSREGYEQLRIFLEARASEITGGNKLLLYNFDFWTKHYSCRQSLEGPHDILNCTSFVEKVKSVAEDTANLLRRYEIPVSQKAYVLPSVFTTQPANVILDDPYGLSMFKSDGEKSGLYTIYDIVLLFRQLVFDYSNSTSSTDDLFYEHAFGELATPTLESIENRIYGFGKEARDGMDNLHSFVYKIYDESNSGKVVVCPEDKYDLITELFGVQPNNTDISVLPNVAERSENNKPAEQIWSSRIEDPEVLPAPPLVTPEENIATTMPKGKEGCAIISSDNVEVKNPTQRAGLCLIPP